VKANLVVCACAVSVFASACSKANASSLDPANPLHCAAQFSAWEVAVRKVGDERKAAVMSARAQWYADRARSLPADQLTEGAMMQLGNTVAAQPDGGKAFAKECWDRQDASPEFQAMLHQGK